MNIVRKTGIFNSSAAKGFVKSVKFKANNRLICWNVTTYFSSPKNRTAHMLSVRPCLVRFPATSNT